MATTVKAIAATLIMRDSAGKIANSILYTGCEPAQGKPSCSILARCYTSPPLAAFRRVLSSTRQGSHDTIPLHIVLCFDGGASCGSWRMAARSPALARSRAGLPGHLSGRIDQSQRSAPTAVSDGSGHARAGEQGQGLAGGAVDDL